MSGWIVYTLLAISSAILLWVIFAWIPRKERSESCELHVRSWAAKVADQIVRRNPSWHACQECTERYLVEVMYMLDHPNGY